MQMIFELDAFLEENGLRKPFQVRISCPSKSAGQNEYFCQVYAPSLFQDEKKIYGVDESQAQTLAMEFIISLIGNRRVVDKNGNPIPFDLRG